MTNQPETGPDSIDRVADVLSARLKEAETRMNRIKGLSSTEIEGPEGNIRFERGGEGWEISLDCTTPDSEYLDWRHWSKCSLQQRGYIAEWLPCLLQTALEARSKRRVQVMRGLAALDTFENMMANLMKEGQ